MAKYVTILDIARELGISKSTVSRALSGDTSNVKAATIEKILGTLHARSSYHHCRGATCRGDGKGGLSIALGTFARCQPTSRGHRIERRDRLPRVFPEEIRITLPTII